MAKRKASASEKRTSTPHKRGGKGHSELGKLMRSIPVPRPVGHRAVLASGKTGYVKDVQTGDVFRVRSAHDPSLLVVVPASGSGRERQMGRATVIDVEPSHEKVHETMAAKKKAQKKTAGRKATAKKTAKGSASKPVARKRAKKVADDDEDEDDAPTTKKGGKGGKPAAAKKGKAKPADDDEDDDDLDDEEDDEDDDSDEDDDDADDSDEDDEDDEDEDDDDSDDEDEEDDDSEDEDDDEDDEEDEDEDEEEEDEPAPVKGKGKAAAPAASTAVPKGTDALLAAILESMNGAREELRTTNQILTQGAQRVTTAAPASKAAPAEASAAKGKKGKAAARKTLKNTKGISKGDTIYADFDDGEGMQPAKVNRVSKTTIYVTYDGDKYEVDPSEEDVQVDA